jgi:hypothetical protein
MKKLTLFSFHMLFAAYLFAGTIDYTYHFSAPTVKQAGTYQVLAFENSFVTGKTGEPALPYQAVKLLLPPGEEAVSVIYSFEEENILEGIYNIYPQQPSQPLSIGSDGIFHKNEAVYASQDFYPAVAWGQYSTHFMNGHSFLLATFTPIKYLPAAGQVSYYGKITVTVETRTTDRAAAALNNLVTTGKISDRVAAFAQNTDMIDNYPSTPLRDGEYQILIIAPPFFDTYYEQLKDIYLVRGLKTEIVPVETIATQGTGQDLQEKIRNYIIAEYQAHGIEHVLLGGDDEHIPHRGFYCHVQSSSVYEDSDIPADLYYSALDGNWNTDGDGYWAEPDEDDLLPDVSVARFPASTTAQLERLINKTVKYQDEPVLGEFQKVVMAGEYLWADPLTYGEDYLELLIGYHEDNGYTTDGMPPSYDFNKLYESQAYWDGSDLMNAINQGTSFVHHSGHANETYVMKFDIYDITNTNFSGANGTDHNYTLVYTHGCLCGAFDVNDCIGEAMVCIDNFAVAGAFNSRYGWFNEGQTEGPSAHMHREFVDALFHDRECRVGAAHMISKIETAPWVEASGQWEEGALRWCFYDCNIFGDPALGVWTNEPITIETSYPDEVACSATSVPVTVTRNGMPVQGLMCVVMADGNMLGCCTTDASGQAAVSIPDGFPAIESAELIVSGYNCLPNHYMLNIMVGLDEPVTAGTAMKIMPNPFTDHLKLTYNLENDQQVTIVICNSSGQQMEEFTCSGKKGLNESTVDTSKWPEGMFQARIIGGNRVIHGKLLHISK